MPQLPAPLGHGALPAEVLQEFSTVVWVGDSDFDFWNDTSIVSYLRAGGNVLFLGRRGQEYLHPARSSWLGLRWAETATPTLASASAVYPGFVNMTASFQSQSAVFETTFDTPETELLLGEPTTFSVPRGTAAWRQLPGGGLVRPSGGHFAFVSGRPYRWERTALRTNIRTILSQLFGESFVPTGADAAPPAVTRLLDPVPNPFNPAVTIRWELAQAGPVRVATYDPQGRRVRTRVGARQQAGPGRIVWDGADDAGRSAIAISSVLAAIAIGWAGVLIGLSAGYLRLVAVLTAGLLLLAFATFRVQTDRANFSLFRYASLYMLSAMIILALQAF